MALPMNKKMLTKKVLPEFELNLNTNGIMVTSNRISTPRFIPYDHNGKCTECKSTEVEIDYLITKEGVTIWCSRIKGSRFVPVDIVRDLPGHTFFKIKNKGRVFNIPHGVPETKCFAQQPSQELAYPFSQQDENIPLHQVLLPPPPPPEETQQPNEGALAMDAMHSIKAATTFLEFAQREAKKEEHVPEKRARLELDGKEMADIQDFVDDLMDTPKPAMETTDEQPKVEEQDKEEKKEEDSAISAIEKPN